MVRQSSTPGPACPTAMPLRSAAPLKSGIELPQLPMNALRARVEREMDRLAGPARILVFGCDRGVDLRRLAAPGVAGIALPCVGMLPPSFVCRCRRLKAVAMRCSRVALGRRSPASCQRRNWSYGRFWLNARMTQSRYGDMSRSTSAW